MANFVTSSQIPSSDFLRAQAHVVLAVFSPSSLPVIQLNAFPGIGKFTGGTSVISRVSSHACLD